MHDPRVGRFFAVDPLTRDFPWNSPFSFSENCLINSIEYEGLEKIALSGEVPKSQYKSNIADDPNDTEYTSTHIKYFKAQGTRLKKEYGFDSFQVFKGQDIVNKLKETTMRHGYVSFLALFGHGGQSGAAGGFFMSNNAGFYTDNVNKESREIGYATISDIQSSMIKGDIKFSDNAVCFLDACNTAGIGENFEASSGNLAYNFVFSTGVTTIAATGHVEMTNTNNADGKFKISENDPGYFWKLTRYNRVETRNIEVNNPNKKSVLEFWKPDKIIMKQKVCVSGVKSENLGKEVDIDTFIK